ncbi:MAG: prepilin peptidase [Anaerolineales bacterium]|nr:prepilin peptidase [Anaerolineales bacterium]
MNELPILLAGGGFTLWALGCGVLDYRTRRVPNAYMALGLAAALANFVRHSVGGQITGFHLVLLTAAWGLALAFWAFGFWGGADAKFTMVLSLAAPDPLLLTILAAAHAGVTLLVTLSNCIPWLGTPTQGLATVTTLAVGWTVWVVAVFASRTWTGG